MSGHSSSCATPQTLISARLDRTRNQRQLFSGITLPFSPLSQQTRLLLSLDARVS